MLPVTVQVMVAPAVFAYGAAELGSPSIHVPVLAHPPPAARILFA